MHIVAKGLVGLAALAFILAVIDSVFTGPILTIPAESFSRAANNLALMAIALMVVFREHGGGPAQH
ncbi:MAG TPA: hypothetical protein VNI57_03110 [Candidatus Saccharimonadales bacterium]|nr:hypothetical protein [Candidatus Saccharimonadales bacterium]